MGIITFAASLWFFPTSAVSEASFFKLHKGMAEKQVSTIFGRMPEASDGCCRVGMRKGCYERRWRDDNGSVMAAFDLNHRLVEAAFIPNFHSLRWRIEIWIHETLGLSPALHIMLHVHFLR